MYFSDIREKEPKGGEIEKETVAQTEVLVPIETGNVLTEKGTGKEVEQTEIEIVIEIETVTEKGIDTKTEIGLHATKDTDS